MAKPSAEFFELVIDAAEVAPHEILYVGDRVDNDILPAHHAGLRTALIRRGPWGYLHSTWPEANIADIQINSLDDLAAALTGSTDGIPSWADELILVVDAHADWHAQGQQLRDDLEVLLARWLTARIEHIGSTAVPGLPAKPIIDLQAAVDNLDDADSIARVLESYDWHYVAPVLDQRPWRRFFVNVADGRRVAHLHIMTTRSKRWHEQIAFRDALRADSDKRLHYAALKYALAEQFSDDREAYSAAKDSFIRATLDER